MFSAVFVSRGLVELFYVRNRRVAQLHVGQIWKPDAPAPGKA